MLTVPSDVVVCWSFKQTTVRKKLLEHQFLKYYAIERKVCPNVELRSNHLAVIKFFVEDGQKIYLTTTLSDVT